MLSYLFTFKGRASRAIYWLGQLPLIFIVWLLPVIFLGHWRFGIKPLIGGGMPGWIDYFLLPALYISINSATKRLHDRNKSGWWQLFVFLPFLLTLALPIIGVIMAQFGIDIGPWLGRWGTANTLTLIGPAYIIFQIIPLVIAALMVIEMGFRGPHDPNRFGPSPHEKPSKP